MDHQDAPSFSPSINFSSGGSFQNFSLNQPPPQSSIPPQGQGQFHAYQLQPQQSSQNPAQQQQQNSPHINTPQLSNSVVNTPVPASMSSMPSPSMSNSMNQIGSPLMANNIQNSPFLHNQTIQNSSSSPAAVPAPSPQFQQQQLPQQHQQPYNNRREELVRYVMRWRQLQQELGADVSNNAEFIALSKILKDFQRTQQQRQAQIQQQQQQSSLPPPPPPQPTDIHSEQDSQIQQQQINNNLLLSQPNRNQSPVMMNSSIPQSMINKGSIPPPPQISSHSSPQPSNSFLPQQSQPQPQLPQQQHSFQEQSPFPQTPQPQSTPPPQSPSGQPLSILSRDQQNLLKSQFLAFKALCRGRTLPQPLQDQLFNPMVAAAFQVAPHPQATVAAPRASNSNTPVIASANLQQQQALQQLPHQPQDAPNFPNISPSQLRLPPNGIPTPQQIPPRIPSATSDSPNVQRTTPNAPGSSANSPQIRRKSKTPSSPAPPRTMSTTPAGFSGQQIAQQTPIQSPSLSQLQPQPQVPLNQRSGQTPQHPSSPGQNPPPSQQTTPNPSFVQQPQPQQQPQPPSSPALKDTASLSTKQPQEAPAAPPAPMSPPPPTTNLEKLGVIGSIPPESFISNEIDISDITPISDKALFIPSLMPLGADIVEIKKLREEDINAQIFDRLVDLHPASEISLDNIDKLSDQEIDKLVEFKSLKLLNQQKALRGDILADLYYFNSVAMNEHNQIHFTRMKQQTLLEAHLTEQFDLQQRTERAQRENQMKRNHLKTICAHSKEIRTSIINHDEKHRKFGRSISSFHSFTEKEEQKRAEKTARQRLQALRANDEEAYIKLLDQTKDTRITHLLKQTNSFLDSLAQAVKNQQRETSSIVTEVDEAASEPEAEEDDEEWEEGEEKVDYYAVAHRVKEVITKQPGILVGGTLKEYQIKGLQWMISLYNNNLNGILADEMGLGKTIQTISLITYLIESKQVPGPYLVIVPLSTLTNWILEFERWAPSVKKVVYKGPPMARKTQQAIVKSGDFQVVLTTYEYIIKDRPILSRIKWVHMIIDEGHRLKNAQSKLSYTLSTYYISKHRLILTGTPLQNNLPELWALLNFVLPKIFNSVKSFDEWFNTPFANTGSQDKMDLSEEETLLIIRRLHKVLRPFLLRRLKKDVEKDLPDKVEKVIKCKMSALQSSLYQQVLRFKKVFIADDSKSGAGAKGLNNKLMQLKKICNHPFVFEQVEYMINPTKSSNALLWRTAGKFELLDRVLPKFKATNHRVLMFFQMTQIMDIMEDFMLLHGYRYLRLDGSTKADERSELLKKFNAPDSPYFAFLLSTRAGGLGLNLQTADTVIIFDTDWNPHQDLQAQDRAHRIGQTKEVRILRLITENSVEETILDRAHQKLEIDGKVIQAGKFDNKSTNEEQEAFLRRLLEQEEMKRAHKNEEEEDMDDEELNEVLARDDYERELFRKIDEERNAASPFGKGRKFDRLFMESELPDVYKEEYLNKEAIEPEPVNQDSYGRGARERKVLYYDDGLTEEQWADAIDAEDDTPEEATARKRARIEKRRFNKLKRDNDDGTSVGSPRTRSPSVMDTPSPVSYSEPMSGSKAGTPASSAGASTGGAGKRKRGRRPRAETEALLSAPSTSTSSIADAAISAIAPPRRKGKGRPPKVKETLMPRERLDLTAKMRTLYDHVLSLLDEHGRPRIELFRELPSKRQYVTYYTIIQNPIAMDMILKRINNNTYQKLGEFRADFQLMFDNARRYNEEGSQVYHDANVMEAQFNEKLNELVPGSVVSHAVSPAALSGMIDPGLVAAVSGGIAGSMDGATPANVSPFSSLTSSSTAATTVSIDNNGVIVVNGAGEHKVNGGLDGANSLSLTNGHKSYEDDDDDDDDDIPRKRVKSGNGVDHKKLGVVTSSGSSSGGALSLTATAGPKKNGTSGKRYIQDDDDDDDDDDYELNVNNNFYDDEDDD